MTWYILNEIYPNTAVVYHQDIPAPPPLPPHHYSLSFCKRSPHASTDPFYIAVLTLDAASDLTIYQPGHYLDTDGRSRVKIIAKTASNKKKCQKMIHENANVYKDNLRRLKIMRSAEVTLILMMKSGDSLRFLISSICSGIVKHSSDINGKQLKT